MKRILLPLAGGLLLGTLVSASQPEPARLFLYRTYDEKTGELVTETRRSIEHLEDGRIRMKISWHSPADSSSGTQEHLLDGSYSTEEWQVNHPDVNTVYSGTREPEALRFHGTLGGEPLEKEIEIDEKPVYVNPAAGLQGFYLSGETETRFHSLRPSNLAEYTMKARIEERDEIELNGQKVRAVRIKWGLSGLKAAFFSTNYWFRESDGLFLFSEASRGTWSEFVEEIQPEP